MAEDRLSHIAEDGTASMVDVSGKPVVGREAVARGVIRLKASTIEMITEDRITKGNVLAVARVAGIQAAKQTQQLIPLCHQIPLTHAAVDFGVREEEIEITCRARTRARTGVEMEALTGVSVAALTIYDMCKAVDGSMEISGIALVSKTKSDEGE